MSDQALIERGDGGVYRVKGVMSFDTVPGLLREGGAMFAGAGRVMLDLNGVTRSDSAGVALLVEWLREARKRGVRLDLRNVTPQMTAIARVSGLEQVLGVSGGGREGV